MRFPRLEHGAQAQLGYGVDDGACERVGHGGGGGHASAFGPAARGVEVERVEAVIVFGLLRVVGGLAGAGLSWTGGGDGGGVHEGGRRGGAGRASGESRAWVEVAGVHIVWVTVGDFFDACVVSHCC